ncbi:DUF2789 domain-containing protein [Halomonas dongshanensis]|uniref:DUF2789 domain-containing protein n=1 Tax=Halomonas dongshanensis TaxID=2890835 RepID=A0ABT2EF47_9GAMM|nr:DUF2789 domain-containing protein [Halomonas dongshanensis]MCS2610208.1 DUF2789 domain-containing protein [Halomonas dongshanensis]
MEQPIHHFSDLFAQLGLPSDGESIEAFIRQHSPIPEGTRLADAECWNESQADFLRQAIERDADWAEIVGHLDATMRNDPRT